MEITRWISPYNNSAGNDVKYIVLHDTGNFKDTAKGNANYFNGGDRQASAHFFVDENSIYQVVEKGRASWHCGDGGGRYGIGNHNSIGIEMCNSGGYIAEATINNTIWLVKQLQAEFKVDNAHVVRHYDASRKHCPNNMSANNWAKWNDFKARLAGASRGSSEESATDYGMATVTAESGINVRDGAGTNYNRIGGLAKGADVRIGRVEGNWANIYFGDHGGWVCMDYLNVYKIFKEPVPVSLTKPVTSGDTFFRVIHTSCTERKNAEGAQAKLKQVGFDSFLAPFKKDGKDYLRVVVGSYKEKANAEETQRKLKAKGFDSFLEAFKK